MADNHTGRGRGRGRGTGTGRGTSQASSLPVPPPHPPTSDLPAPPPYPPTSSLPTPPPHPPTSSSPTLAPLPVTSTSSARSPHPRTSGIVASSSSDPHASSSVLPQVPRPGTIDPDGLMWIRPGPGMTFEPEVGPPHAISNIMKSKFEGAWKSYREVDDRVKEMWFIEFGKKYKWLPEDHKRIKKSFDYKGSELLKNALCKVRHNQDKGNWIPTHVREELDRQWRQDPKWLEKKSKNTQNRKSEEGLSKDTGGSILAIAHKKKLKQQLKRDPRHWELFTRFHTRKGKWISTKAKNIADEYQKRISERDSQRPPGEETIDINSDNNIYLDVVGGISSKKRIFGLGSDAGSHASSSSASAEGCSQSEMEAMRSLVASLSTQVVEQGNLINTILQRLNASTSGSQATDSGYENDPLGNGVGDGDDDDYNIFPPDV